MAAISRSQVTDERVTGLRIYADAEGETHMEDIDIGLLYRKHASIWGNNEGTAGFVVGVWRS